MRLIDADAAEDKLGVSDEDINFKYFLRGCPTIEAVPVVHGRWDYLGYVGRYEYYGCTVCHGMEQKQSDYCPNCGAKMDGGKDDG